MEIELLKISRECEAQKLFPKQARETIQSFRDALEKLQGGLASQESQSELMKNKIQDLLDFASIKNNKFRKNIKEFDVRKAVESVMDVQRKMARDQGL